MRAVPTRLRHGSCCRRRVGTAPRAKGGLGLALCPAPLPTLRVSAIDRNHSCTSLHGNIAVADHLRPLSDLAPDPGRERLGRTRNRIEAELQQALPELRRRNDL